MLCNALSTLMRIGLQCRGIPQYAFNLQPIFMEQSLQTIRTMRAKISNLLHGFL